jgi:hypothetical protein
MSNLRIQDGTGAGNVAKVDNKNRLYTNAVTIDEQVWSSEEGDGYNINTGLIALSSASESACLYMKYTGTRYFNITALAVGVGDLGAATDPAFIKMYRNPTGGTIIDNAVTSGIQNQNRNFGATGAVSANIYKGVEGDTLTGGDVIASFYQNQNGRLFAGINFILAPQTSIGVSLTPNDDGTGGNTYIALIGYEGTE